MTQGDKQYLLFKGNSDEKCRINQGQGSILANKYRVGDGHFKNRFFIDSESFEIIERGKDTCDVNIKDLNIVDVQYMINKKNENPLRINPFGKIFLIEVIGNHQMLIHKVGWIDEWEEIE
ncbi:MAG: hypothetical protein ACK5M7_18920 [Draconibacterium sp.]